MYFRLEAQQRRCGIGVILLLASVSRLPAPIQEIPETPTPTVAASANATEFSVSVVEDFVRSLRLNDLDAQLRLYADRVIYYEMGRVAKDVVRRDLERDIRTWPTRVYFHDTIEITHLSPDIVQAKFAMPYTLTNSKGRRSGLLQMKVLFRLEGGAWRIFEIEKKPIVARKNY
jgi:hypothetical protein